MDKIQQIAVIGEGRMGTNLVVYLLDYDFTLIWVVSKKADIGKHQKIVEKKVKRLLLSGTHDQQWVEQKIHNTLITSDLSSCAHVDLFIEAISENLESKKELFKVLDLVAKPSAILTSNSSSIEPSRIVPENRQPNAAGLHFFYPVNLKKVVELVPASRTSQETVQTLQEFVGEIDKSPLHLPERAHSVLNRIFLELQVEAMNRAQSEGIPLRVMDRIIKEHVTPLGVFDFCDQVGIDVMLASTLQFISTYPHPSHYQLFLSKLQELDNAGKLGVKTGGGFFTDDERESTEEVIRDENLVNMVNDFKSTINRSIAYWAEISALPVATLEEAMNEYLAWDA